MTVVYPPCLLLASAVDMQCNNFPTRGRGRRLRLDLGKLRLCTEGSCSKCRTSISPLPGQRPVASDSAGRQELQRER